MKATSRRKAYEPEPLPSLLADVDEFFVVEARSLRHREKLDDQETSNLVIDHKPPRTARTRLPLVLGPAPLRPPELKSTAHALIGSFAFVVDDQ